MYRSAFFSMEAGRAAAVAVDHARCSTSASRSSRPGSCAEAQRGMSASRRRGITSWRALLVAVAAAFSAAAALAPLALAEDQSRRVRVPAAAGVARASSAANYAFVLRADAGALVPLEQRDAWRRLATAADAWRSARPAAYVLSRERFKTARGRSERPAPRADGLADRAAGADLRPVAGSGCSTRTPA